MKGKHFVTLSLIIGLMLCFASCSSDAGIKSAIKDRDVDKLSEIITEYNESEKNDKYDKILTEAISEQCENEDVEDAIFFDEVLEKIKGSKTEKSMIKALDANASHLVKPFLSADWIRQGDDFAGMRLSVTINNENGLAVVTDVSKMAKNDYKFRKDDIKWKNIIILDRETFQYEDLAKQIGGLDPKYYSSIGKIDYKKKTVKMKVTGSSNSIGTKQTWSRE